MKCRSSILSIPFLFFPSAVFAQQAAQQSTPVRALRDNTPGVHALTGARIVVTPGRVLENATLIIRDGRIEAVGNDVRVPPDAIVRDMSGRTLYAGFIDAHADLGLDDAPEEPDPGPVGWNPQVRPQFDAGLAFASKEEESRELRSQGFTVAHAVPKLGIFRGATALVSLGDGPARNRVLAGAVAQSVAFSRSQELGDTYPNSPMGSIALIRQTFLDADWYARARAAHERDPARVTRPEANLALAALERASGRQQPVLFETTAEEEYLRVQKLTEEFPVDVWVRGSGEEYRILDVVSAARVPLIVPLDFPDPPEVESPEEALDVSLAELRHWYLAPENPARLARAGVQFALTADGLDDLEDFLPNLRQAVELGLDPSNALAALTTTPAGLLGIQATHGTLEPGKAADVVVVEGDLFDDDAEIRDVWIAGIRHEVSAAPRSDARGEWSVVTAAGQEGRLTLTGDLDDLEGTLQLRGRHALDEVDLESESARLRITVPGESFGQQGAVRLSGSVSEREMFGWAELPDGTRQTWTATRVGSAGAARGARTDADRPAARLDLPDIRPAMEYGRERIPEQPAAVLVRNATVWTQGPQGRLQNADVLVRAGRIEQVGQNLASPAGATVIDGTGKHVTPGLIDPHLHSGVSGVNETGAAIVPEVRMGDVVTHNNIWMYRQLAGGLTTAHVKHGSANPIGGENVVMKMRWGALPDGLRLDGAPRTVKFALGENPKRAGGERYPDTRMGVHQIIRDHFQAALDYRRTWQEWERTGEGLPPRKDLRMEALVDMLEGELWISSHGYRQDEFLMVIRLAEEFGFRVRTLQHGVEAYKIAPELAASGVAAVVWSDWSSFKIEAYDATTYNARILTEAGVLTSLHSDNSQLASRMNWEAAKLLRTGMGEEQALSLVTINPAKILGLDARIGSLEPGKDADLVIWSGSPLSTSTIAEQTWVDGRKYFDVVEDREMRRRIERERALLVQAALQDG
jgi:imidazolonepropionase-like amidohydrolase